MEIVLLEGCVLMSFCLRDKDDSSTSKFQSRGLIYQELDSCETPLVGAVISFSCFFFFFPNYTTRSTTWADIYRFRSAWRRCCLSPDLLV